MHTLLFRFTTLILMCGATDLRKINWLLPSYLTSFLTSNVNATKSLVFLPKSNISDSIEE